MAGLALAALPSTAYAAVVGLQSADGTGTFELQSSAALGWVGAARFQSTSGGAVYVSGKVIWNLYPDHSCGRVSGDTFAALRSETVRCSALRAPVSASDAAGLYLCRNRTALPDPCGPERRVNY